MLTKLLATRDDWVLTWIRLVAGCVMFPHGMQKLLGWFGGAGFTRSMHIYTQMGIPAPFVFLAIMAESFGSLGLILGCFSRIAAFGIVVDMIVAGSIVYQRFGHFFMNWGGKQSGEGIEYHLLMIGMAVVVLIAGGGKFSIDRALSGRNSG